MQQSSLKRVCLISNYNLYESKRHFTLKLAEAMQRKGIETLHIDVKESALNAEVLGAIARFNPTLTCSFNILRPISPDMFLWDYLQIPHWSILLDPVIYSMELTKSPYAIVSCVDLEDDETLKAQGFENSFFFPHAIERELIGSGSAEKIYDVVFLGSCYDYESLQALWQKEQPEEINQIILNAAKRVLSDATTSITQALYLAVQESNVTREMINYPMLFYCIDRYTRGLDRVELIKSIQDAEVHVFGSPAEDEITTLKGWDYYLAGCKNVVLHPPVSFQKGLDILKQSKIALNSVPFFKNGSHERVFTALACGALPLTSATQYWEENFVEGKELAFYRFGKYQEMNAQIENLLADELKRQEIVTKGAQKVSSMHTWDQRADLLLQTLPPLLMMM